MGLSFIHDDWLLDTPQAVELYHRHAAHQPIIDFHNHLSASEIAENRTFESIGEIWLAHDHYKWRAMRANGIPERLITGDAAWREKFQAWAETVPYCLGGPLYAWTHLELVRHFGIHETLHGESAERIWNAANERLAELSVWKIFEMFRVRVVGTTDDPADSLERHEALRDSACPALAAPTFRPDRLLNPGLADWPDRVRRLGEAVGSEIASEEQLLEALAVRLGRFRASGGRATDHGIDDASRISQRRESARRMQAATEAAPAELEEEGADQSSFRAALAGDQFSLMVQRRISIGGLRAVWAEAARLGMTVQVHAGARREASSRLQEIGRDTGGDMIGRPFDLDELADTMDRLDQDGCLPRMILFNCHPADNLPFAALAATFCRGPEPAKVQLGPAWWHLDQIDGISENLRAQMNLGLLGRSVGMTTDSRSFLSFPRHECFRRVLCRLLGRMMAAGELPGDSALIGGLVEDVCFRNARDQFGFDLPESAAG
jgi:glucuronate isomerase